MVVIATTLSVNHHHHHHLQQRNTEQKGAKHIVLVEIVLVGEKFSLGPILQACVPALCQPVFSPTIFQICSTSWFAIFFFCCCTLSNSLCKHEILFSQSLAFILKCWSQAGRAPIPKDSEGHKTSNWTLSSEPLVTNTIRGPS